MFFISEIFYKKIVGNIWLIGEKLLYLHKNNGYENFIINNWRDIILV